MKQLMIETVKRSTPEEVAQLLCDMTEEANGLRQKITRWRELLERGHTPTVEDEMWRFLNGQNH